MLAGKRRRRGLRHRRERAIDVLGLDVAMEDALRGEIERIEDAAQAGISRERADQRLRRDQLIGEILHLLLRQEEQALLAEENVRHRDGARF